MLDWRILTNDGKRMTRAAPVAFNIEERIINLSLEGDTEHRGLMMKLSLSKQLRDYLKETTNESVLQQCEVFRLIITPFIKAAMCTLSGTSLLSAKQEQLPRTLTKIVMQRKYGHIYNFFMRLKEHQVNKVPIFTRLKSYKNIVNRCYDNWGIEERIGYDEDAKREYLTRFCAL
jgi:hypothetical protein